MNKETGDRMKVVNRLEYHTNTQLKVCEIHTNLRATSHPTSSSFFINSGPQFNILPVVFTGFILYFILTFMVRKCSSLRQKRAQRVKAERRGGGHNTDGHTCPWAEKVFRGHSPSSVTHTLPVICTSEPVSWRYVGKSPWNLNSWTLNWDNSSEAVLFLFKVLLNRLSVLGTIYTFWTFLLVWWIQWCHVTFTWEDVQSATSENTCEGVQDLYLFL